MKKELAYILLVDDDPDDLEIFVSAYTNFNPHVSIKTVNNAMELFEFLDDHGNTAELPALFLIDYKMPLIPGPEILQMLSSNPTYSGIPKLIWSTSNRSKDIDECMRHGADRYFIKPATSSEMDELIRQVDTIFAARSKRRKTG